MEIINASAILKKKKTINVDIRYVLFIIDKYAGAKHIVDEMTIIR